MLEEIYTQLTEEGFLQRAVGSGTFVAPTISRRSAPNAARKPDDVRPRLNTRVPVASRRGRLVAAMAACREPAVPRAFNAGMADTSEFPWNTWRRLHATAARALGSGGLNFADPRGLWICERRSRATWRNSGACAAIPGRLSFSTARNRRFTF